MNWETIFGIANLWALLGWVILAFAPKREIAVPFVFFAGSVLLACLYAGLIIPLMAGLISDGGPAGRPPADFTSLSGVMALFDSPGGATIGWIHYLAFDLFVGIWIARNADAHNISRWLQVPTLFFTLMAGPIGLLLYLLLRQFVGEKPEYALLPS
ncbi:ABA4-like family protein [Sphingorhabdus sp.]|uniref:ABA4-like family protein n=1 Tax=Sphingorhabdus sp. TaxID=1902408 RepID=UPI00391A53A9